MRMHGSGNAGSQLTVQICTSHNSIPTSTIDTAHHDAKTVGSCFLEAKTVRLVSSGKLSPKATECEVMLIRSVSQGVRCLKTKTHAVEVNGNDCWS